MDDQATLTSMMPPAWAHLADEPELAAAWQQQVAARQAEAVKITSLLDYKKRLVAEYRHQPAALLCEVERVAVRDAARLLGLSELTTSAILESATVAQSYLPATWDAFQQGRIDMMRVRKITAATGDLSDELLPQVDATAAEQAALRGIADFHNWLLRHLARVDFAAYDKLCASRRRSRHVRFTHRIDGMSYLEARLPTVEAAAIEKRLTITALRHHSHDTADERTLAQREADLLSSWLRTGDTPEEGAAAVDAKIMIMIPESTLTGESEEPAMAADRSWMLPAEGARRLASHPGADHQWYQGITRPNSQEADHDVLSITYAGRYPPQRLRDALIFRDGACQSPGCTITAERCDLDHQTPWDSGGKTTAKNLWALCRRHHRLKSHGFLHPPARGDTATSPSKTPSRSKTPPVDLWLPTHTFALSY